MIHILHQVLIMNIKFQCIFMILIKCILMKEKMKLKIQKQKILLMKSTTVIQSMINIQKKEIQIEQMILTQENIHQQYGLME